MTETDDKRYFKTVIASEAKQSIAAASWIASSLRSLAQTLCLSQAMTTGDI